MAALVALAFCSPQGLHAQSKDKAVPAIRFPVAPTPPTPEPASPVPVNTLTADNMYVIDSDVPLLVFTSPDSLVTVSVEAGPVKIKGRFVDGTGKVETRTFKGKEVYTIEPAGSAAGTVELIVVPVGATKTTDAIRKSIKVNGGVDPPPGPGPGPGPNPPPNPPPTPDPVDPVLLGKIQTAAGRDQAAKADLVALGKVYTDGAAYLDSTADPNVRPKTYGDVVEYLSAQSRAAGVPVLPALQYTRGVVATEGGTYERLAPFDATLKATLVAKYKKIGAALTAAGK